MELAKITESPNPPRRRYDDACGTAHALDLIGERWALLVIRELMLGPKRFSDIRGDLPGISANVLTQRLEGLESSGIVIRRRLPPPASAQVYELTEWGYQAEPIIQEMGRWAARSPAHDPSLQLSGTSLMMSFRTMFDRDKARGLTGSAGFRIGNETLLARVADGRLEAGRGDIAAADVVFTGSAPAIAAFIYGEVPLVALEAEAGLGVTGDRGFAERFADLFNLPPKAALPALA